MKTRFLLIICISLAGAYSYGAPLVINSPVEDTITSRKILGGYQFSQNGRVLNFNRLQSVLKTDENAFSIFKPAKSTYTLATVLGVAGGALIGWPIGTAIAGRDPEWLMLGAGVVLAGISVPVSIKSGKQIKKAVDAFNLSQNNSSSATPSKELRLETTLSGVGMVLHF